MRAKRTPRRASSIARVRPAAPAPQIRTSTGLRILFLRYMCKMHILGGQFMITKKKVQDTHISAQLKDLHRSLISIVSVMNRPRNDERLIAEAGVQLDQTLFRLLVVIERVGPIGVVDLADRLGRDYTTISRQLAKLESMGMVMRHENAGDRRMREAVVSAKGKAVT